MQLSALPYRPDSKVRNTGAGTANHHTSTQGQPELETQSKISRDVKMSLLLVTLFLGIRGEKYPKQPPDMMGTRAERAHNSGGLSQGETQRTRICTYVHDLLSMGARGHGRVGRHQSDTQSRVGTCSLQLPVPELSYAHTHTYTHTARMSLCRPWWCLYLYLYLMHQPTGLDIYRRHLPQKRRVSMWLFLTPLCSRASERERAAKRETKTSPCPMQGCLVCRPDSGVFYSTLLYLRRRRGVSYSTCQLGVLLCLTRAGQLVCNNNDSQTPRRGGCLR